MEAVDKRFVLVADNGDKLYPYKKSQESTRRYGYALTRPGQQDRNGQGDYPSDIKEVIKRLVFDGWSVRAKTIDRTGRQREGSLGIEKRSIRGYEIAEELRYLVDGAERKPISILPSNKSAESSTESDRSRYLDAGEQSIDEKTYKSIKSRRGQPEFRKALFSVFSGRCCISCSTVASVLEAAHIIPHNEKTNYSVSNGLLLRADIHTLFDLSLIQVNANGEIVVSESLKATEYWAYQGQYVAVEIPDDMSENLRQRFSLQGTS